MNNPGAFQIPFGGSALAVAEAGTYVSDWVSDLDGLKSLSLQASFKPGSGGTSVTVYFQTSLDQGQTPIDIWALQFTTTPGTLAVNLDTAALNAAITPTDGTLTAGDIVNGILGDRVRAKVVVVGEYMGSTLLNLTGVAR
ncbi:hypothetical protein CWB41_13990 [Methylovirgula ligni]|uniref:Uncharacterized protein n=1 Tax=Methylovirgula ligni TaxID=569860 RepID=A0A3D9YL28_9HYPH|nr:hypothetical protein [Methylovirgula ligni]QAY96704.1 hypothetical protein CWB41_13990 [Methylovirgula ligni]REF83255.1 hypothetical protein DES32_3171 [Methylovirgula ligni]